MLNLTQLIRELYLFNWSAKPPILVSLMNVLTSCRAARYNLAWQIVVIRNLINVISAGGRNDSVRFYECFMRPSEFDVKKQIGVMTA